MKQLFSKTLATYSLIYGGILEKRMNNPYMQPLQLDPEWKVIEFMYSSSYIEKGSWIHFYIELSLFDRISNVLFGMWREPVR